MLNESKINVLKGYQNTTPETFGEGMTVGYNGKCYNVMDFDPKYLTLEIIAKSLSKQCRYIGNTHGFISVAQHSVMMAQAAILIGDINLAYESICHDIGECLISDISSPLKKIFKKMGLKKIEEDIDKKIAEHFGCNYPSSKDLEILDKNFSQMEMSICMKDDIFIDYWEPEKAEKMFLNMFKIIEKMKLYNDKPNI